MIIKFVGHAGFIIKGNGISLLIDPWVVGSAFNDSWLPYPQPVLMEDDIAEVTHLWISHEHPDHFSIPTLKLISEANRKNITVLFQDRISKEVADFLGKSCFAKVKELPHAKWVSLGEHFSIYCRQIGHLDSCLAVKLGINTILNLNDCECPSSTLRCLLVDVGPIDVLLNQFSVAGWMGNPDDVERKNLEAKEKLDSFVNVCNTIKPRKIVPFASFARFCTSENYHINAHANSPQDVVDLLGVESVVVLYPGDVWDINNPHSSEEALRKYSKDRENLSSQPLLDIGVKTMEEILSVANETVKQVQHSYHSCFLRWVPPVRFYVYDLDRYFIVDLKRGVSEISDGLKEWDIKLSSQVAWFAFSVRYGLPAVGASGRFELGSNSKPFMRLKKLGSAYSSGFTSKSTASGLGQFLPSKAIIRYMVKRPGDIFSQFVARLK